MSTKRLAGMIAGLMLSTASFGAMATDLVIYHSWSAPPEIAALNVLKSGLDLTTAQQNAARRRVTDMGGLRGHRTGRGRGSQLRHDVAVNTPAYCAARFGRPLRSTNF